MDLHTAFRALSDAHHGKSIRFIFELTRADGIPEDVAALEEQRLSGAPIDRGVVRVKGDLFGWKGSAKWTCNLDVRMLRRDDARSNRPLSAKDARELANTHSRLSYPEPSMITGASTDDFVGALDCLVSGQVLGRPPRTGFDQWAFDPASLHVCKVPTGTKALEARAALAQVLAAVFDDPGR